MMYRIYVGDDWCSDDYEYLKDARREFNKLRKDQTVKRVELWREPPLVGGKTRDNKRVLIEAQQRR